jgi:transcriptional regulator with XRE-family HTH domain
LPNFTYMVNIDLYERRFQVEGMLTPEQCRAARGLLHWTQEELSQRAGVSRSTVRGFENGLHELHRGRAAVIRAALEAADVVLIDADEQGPGVRLRKPEGH